MNRHLSKILLMTTVLLTATQASLADSVPSKKVRPKCDSLKINQRSHSEEQASGNIARELPRSPWPHYETQTNKDKEPIKAPADRSDTSAVTPENTQATASAAIKTTPSTSGTTESGLHPEPSVAKAPGEPTLQPKRLIELDKLVARFKRRAKNEAASAHKRSVKMRIVPPLPTLGQKNSDNPFEGTGIDLEKPLVMH